METIIFRETYEYTVRELLQKVYPDVHDDYDPVTGYEYFLCDPSDGSPLHLYRRRRISGEEEAAFVFSGSLADCILFLDPDFDFSADEF